jgi:predicted aconitase
MMDFTTLNIDLSEEEIDILNGNQGEMLQKVLKTVVLYGEALEADRLIDIEGPGHFVIPWCSPGIAPPIEMLEELVTAGLKTKYPFTLDPNAPLDFENLNLEPEVEAEINEMYKDQGRYDELMIKLGLRDKDAYTCNPYQPEVGNIPEFGTILAWSESACAVYANSVLGAKTNRNGAIMDLLSNIVGKTPHTEFLTDEGRKASWLIEIMTKELANPQLLGAMIGQKVVSDVPYIIGLENFLGKGINDVTRDYLQEMGTACATYGAVGLYHVEQITPEAVTQGRGLLVSNYTRFVIGDEDIQSHFHAYPLMWTDDSAKPETCYIGCPHLSYRQMNWWSDKIDQTLKERNQDELAVKTVIFAAPQVIEKFKLDEEKYQHLLSAGVNVSPSCCETIFETRLCNGKPILTNSNKLRAYTSARFFPDEELVEIIVNGEIPEGINNG